MQSAMWQRLFGRMDIGAGERPPRVSDFRLPASNTSERRSGVGWREREGWAAVQIDADGEHLSTQLVSPWLTQKKEAKGVKYTKVQVLNSC